MIFQKLPRTGAYLIRPEPVADERGFFARLWNGEELKQRGLESSIDQVSVSFNRRKGTLRGLHFQIAPYEEVKFVRCTAGAVYDVVVDIRPDSRTFFQWDSIELSSENKSVLYVPKGLAHGYQSLVDGSEVEYLISGLYKPEAARGVRWNDPALGIPWPLPVSCIVDRDLEFPLLPDS